MAYLSRSMKDGMLTSLHRGKGSLHSGANSLHAERSPSVHLQPGTTLGPGLFDLHYIGSLHPGKTAITELAAKYQAKTGYRRLTAGV